MGIIGKFKAGGRALIEAGGKTLSKLQEIEANKQKRRDEGFKQQTKADMGKLKSLTLKRKILQEEHKIEQLKPKRKELRDPLADLF